jgi:hypothetical protein
METNATVVSKAPFQSSQGGEAEQSEQAQLQPSGEIAPLATALMPGLNEALHDLVAGQLSAHTRRAYTKDAQVFFDWLQDQNLTLPQLTSHHLGFYRRFLVEHFAKATAARRLVVVRRLLHTAVSHGILSSNPAATVPGFKNANWVNLIETAATGSGENLVVKVKVKEWGV